MAQITEVQLQTLHLMSLIALHMDSRNWLPGHHSRFRRQQLTKCDNDFIAGSLLLTLS